MSSAAVVIGTLRVNELIGKHFRAPINPYILVESSMPVIFFVSFMLFFFMENAISKHVGHVQMPHYAVPVFYDFMLEK